MVNFQFSMFNFQLNKHTYLHGFTLIVIILALGRCGYDYTHKDDAPLPSDTLATIDKKVVAVSRMNYEFSKPPSFKSLTDMPHRVYSVPDFSNTFPDENDVQLIAADENGVRPPKNREEAEHRMEDLVFVGANPYFYVDNLKQSIPYLVPKAAMLLHDIGKSFYDSLYVKGIPLHQIIVTSVLRTDEDVARLQRFNHNATENSCHRYGTTFDIGYNRYKTVSTTDEPRRQVRNDTLKWVLAEVLRDKRVAGRCYIKHEVKQGCFHITVR